MQSLIEFKELLRQQHLPLIIVAVADLDVYGVDRLMQLTATESTSYSSLSGDLEEHLVKLNEKFVGGRLDWSKPVFLIVLLEQHDHKRPLVEVSDMFVTLDYSGNFLVEKSRSEEHIAAVRTTSAYIIFDGIRKTFNKGIWQ